MLRGATNVRFGGEPRVRYNAYTQEAVRLIQQKQTSVLGLFGPRAGL